MQVWPHLRPSPKARAPWRFTASRHRWAHGGLLPPSSALNGREMAGGGGHHRRDRPGPPAG